MICFGQDSMTLIMRYGPWKETPQRLSSLISLVLFVNPPISWLMIEKYRLPNEGICWPLWIPELMDSAYLRITTRGLVQPKFWLGTILIKSSENVKVMKI